MTIDALGRVGIGTTDPYYKLDVLSPNTTTYSTTHSGGGAVPWAALRLYDGGEGNATGILFEASAHDGNYAAGIAGVPLTGGDGVGDLTFHTASGNVLYERMRINSVGSVGVGGAPLNNIRLLATCNATNSGSSVGIRVNALSGSELFSIDSRGFAYFAPLTSWGTGGTAVGISGGFLTTSPSSVRYKENITPLTVDCSKIYDLEAIEFDYKSDGRHSFGYSAEATFDVLPCLVHMEEHEGELVPESISYDHVSVLVVEEMKKLKLENKTLKSQMSEVLARLDNGGL